MNIREIIKDALRYPLSDWKKIIILGIILYSSGIAGKALSYTTNIDVLSISICIGFLVGFLVNGYLFKILKSSLCGQWELPRFSDWELMFIDGVKVFAVFFVYLILPILVILPILASIFLLLFFGSDFTLGDSFFATNLASSGLSPLTFVVPDITSVVPTGILSFVYLFEPTGLIAPSFIYFILIIPVILLAIGNMAYYNGEFRSAFIFREILDDIMSIGVISLIKWYIVTGIIFLALFFIGDIIAFILIQFNPIKEINLVWVIVSLTITPYSYMFLTRALALFYKPE